MAGNLFYRKRCGGKKIFPEGNENSGQALTEYVVVAGMLMASVAVLALFFRVFGEYGRRIYELVSSEYP